MFNPDLFYRARWDQLYTLFFSGNPPLILKLLVINTLFVALFIYRRARYSQKVRSNTAYAFQAVLIAANAFMIFEKDMMGFTSSARSMLNF